MKRSEMVHKIARALYERRHGHGFMPKWEEAPSDYVRGCLNDAHVALLACEEDMFPPYDTSSDDEDPNYAWDKE